MSNVERLKQGMILVATAAKKVGERYLFNNCECVVVEICEEDKTYCWIKSTEEFPVIAKGVNQ